MLNPTGTITYWPNDGYSHFPQRLCDSRYFWPHYIILWHFYTKSWYRALLHTAVT